MCAGKKNSKEKGFEGKKKVGTKEGDLEKQKNTRVGKNLGKKKKAEEGVTRKNR